MFELHLVGFIVFFLRCELTYYAILVFLGDSKFISLINYPFHLYYLRLVEFL